MTEIGLTVTEDAKAGRTWDLAGDVADSILVGNAHADRFGNKAVWSFVKGPARPTTAVASGAHPAYPANSLLARSHQRRRPRATGQGRQARRPGAGAAYRSASGREGRINL